MLFNQLLYHLVAFTVWCTNVMLRFFNMIFNSMFIPKLIFVVLILFLVFIVLYFLYSKFVLKALKFSSHIVLLRKYMSTIFSAFKKVNIKVSNVICRNVIYDEDTDELAKTMRAYICNQDFSGALMLIGNWGFGKTFFLKNFSNVPWFKWGAEQCYVSLNGVKSKNEVTLKLWKSILVGNLWHTSLIIVFLIALVSAFVSSDNFWPFLAFMRDNAASMIFSIVVAIFAFSWTLGKHKALECCLVQRYIVLDDFERAKMSYDELFAYINELIENDRVHIIISCNEKFLLEELDILDKHLVVNEKEDNIVKVETMEFQGKKEAYLNACEKTVQKKIYLSHSAQFEIKLFKYFIKQFEKNHIYNLLLEHAETISKTIFSPSEKYGVPINFRHMKFCINECFDLFSNISNEENILKDKKWVDIFTLYLAVKYNKGLPELTQEIKNAVAHLADANIDIITDVTTEEKSVNIFWELYPTLISTYLELAQELWEVFICEKISPPMKAQFDKLLKQQLYPASNHLADEWRNMRSLSPDEMEKLWENTKKQFTAGAIMTLNDFLEILTNIVKMLDNKANFNKQIQLKSQNGVQIACLDNEAGAHHKEDDLYSEALNFLIQYINQGHISFEDEYKLTSKSFILQITDRLYLYKMAKTGFSEQSLQLIADITNSVLKNAREQKNNISKEYSAQLLENITNTTEKWDEWWIEEKRYEDGLLEMVKIEDLISILDKLDTGKMLAERLGSLMRSLVIYNSSADMPENTRIFWEKFADALEKKALMEQHTKIIDWKLITYNEFAQYIKDFFKENNPSKDSNSPKTPLKTDNK